MNNVTSAGHRVEDPRAWDPIGYHIFTDRGGDRIERN